MPEARTGEPAGSKAVSILPVLSASVSGYPSSSRARQRSPMTLAHRAQVSSFEPLVSARKERDLRRTS